MSALRRTYAPKHFDSLHQTANVSGVSLAASTSRCQVTSEAFAERTIFAWTASSR
jgi:hypothetical protein